MVLQCCVGRLIFLRRYLTASADLGLGLYEQAAMLGLDTTAIST